MEWNVILNTVKDNHMIPSKNNPKTSGEYICTCIRRIDESEYYRYLRVMFYNADKNYWHDIGNESGISHTILAWKEEQVCNFSDFEYKAGEVFKVEKTKTEPKEHICRCCGNYIEQEHLYVCNKCASEFVF